jgi:polyhydroxyalkanoate synthesis repressor PhaR
MRTIRKYPNRRLYDTEAGGFIKLSDLRTLIVAGEDIRVEDKDSGEDITRSLLLQVISEAEADGHPILSERLLTDLIRMHDHPMHDYMTPYLERSVALLMSQVDQMQSRVSEFMETGPIKAWQGYAQESLNWWSNLMRGSEPPDDGDSKS